MKKISIILLLAFGLTLTGHSQSVRILNLYEKYRGEEGVVSVYLPGFVMKLGAAIADIEGPERKLVRSIRSLRVLTIENASLNEGVNFCDELRLDNYNHHYQPLLEVHDGTEDVLILGKEKRGKLKHLLIVVGGKENVLVHIRGRMNADMLASIAEIADIEGLQYTRQL